MYMFGCEAFEVVYVLRVDRMMSQLILKTWYMRRSTTDYTE